MNNLKQIGLALQNYYDVRKCFPYGKGPTYTAGSPTPANYARWSTHSALMPYMEETTNYQMINYSMPPATPGMAGAVAFMPAYQNPNGENSVISQTLVSGFLCPSDLPPGDPTWPGVNNYAGNQGGWLCDRSDTPGLPTDVSPTELQTGVLYYLSHVQIRQVSDGMSKTLFFSERTRGTGSPNPLTDMFKMSPQTSLAATYSTCMAMDPTTATPVTSKWGWSWVMGENCCTLYNHVSTPNTNACAGTGFSGTMTNMAMQVPPSSRHSGGVNAMYGDGSVTFITDTVDLTLWRGLGTRAGGEIIDTSSL